MLHVRRMSGEEVAAVPVGKFATVGGLKRFLLDRCELHGFRLRLLCDGKIWDDGQHLESAGELQLVVQRPFVDADFHQRYRFVRAAEAGSVAEVEGMLQLPQDPDARAFLQKPFTSAWPETPLGAAAAKGQDEVVRLLLSAGAKVNLRSHQSKFDPKGKTPLFQASHSGHSEVVRLLLAAQADQNQACGVEALTPLHAAVRSNHLGVARLLLGAAADTNKACGEETPLIAAISRSHTEMVQLLLENGVDKEQVLDYETPLSTAIRKGREEIVRLLLEAGADGEKLARPLGYFIFPLFWV